MGNINVGQTARLRCYIEPNGSLGTNHSGTIADFWDVPAIEGSIDLKVDPKNIEKKYLRQNRDQWAGMLRGIGTATLSFEVPWFFSAIRSASGGSPAAIAATPTSKLLAAWLGGCALGTSMDANASCTASLIKTSDYANAAEGCGVAWKNASGKLEARTVVDIDGSNDLTLDQALSAAPTAADIIYRGIDLYLADRTKTACTSFQFILSGVEYEEDAWLLRAGQCLVAPTLTLKNGERPTWKFTIEFAAYSRIDAVLLSNSNVTYTNVNEVLVSDGIFTAWAINTAAPITPVAIKTGIAVSECSFDFANSKRIPITTPGGVGNVAHYMVVGDSPKVTGKFRCPWEEDDQTWLDLMVSQGKIALNLQIGSSYTQGCGLIRVAAAEITDWQRVTNNGILEQEISWSAVLDMMHDTGIDTATELANSPFKLYMF